MNIWSILPGFTSKRSICCCVPSPQSTRYKCSLMLSACEDGFLLKIGVAELLPSIVTSNFMSVNNKGSLFRLFLQLFFHFFHENKINGFFCGWNDRKYAV